MACGPREAGDAGRPDERPRHGPAASGESSSPIVPGGTTHWSGRRAGRTGGPIGGIRLPVVRQGPPGDGVPRRSPGTQGRRRRPWRETDATRRAMPPARREPFPDDHDRGRIQASPTVGTEDP